MNLSARTLHATIATALLLASAPAAAQPTVTFFAGYGGSSGIENASTGVEADIESAASFGVALGMALDGSREGQLLYRQQSTTLSPGGGAAPFDLTVRYLHIGGTVFIDQPIGRGPYVVGGIGATFFSPSTSGYGSETKPSLNLGLGYYWPLNDRVALRAEVRGYFTLVDSSGGFLCSGGCVAVLSGDVFSQYEGLIGLTARF